MKQFAIIRAALCTAAALLLTGCGLETISAGSSAAQSDQSDAPVTTQPDVTEASPQSAPADTTAASQTDAQPVPADGRVLIEGVPHLDQSTGYATACESLAACSLMQFYGYDIQPGTFIKEHLPVADYPYDSDGDGVLEAMSPWDYFIGSPLKSNGYGCYSTAIFKAMESVAPGAAEVLRNVPLADLCRDYIDKGQPVMIWATIEMQPTREGHSWMLPNGERFTYTRPEHALVLIGYDADSYLFSDSLREADVTPYSKAAVETAYQGLFEQAIVIKKPAAAANASAE